MQNEKKNGGRLRHTPVLAPAVSYANNSPTKLYGESSISYHIQYPQQEDEVLSVNKSKLTELSSSWCTAAGAITGDCRDYILNFNSTAATKNFQPNNDLLSVSG